MLDKEIEVFIAFAQQDIEHLRELENHLRPLEREGLITVWDERRMIGGMDREQVIHKHFNAASIILLLISADFMASDTCFNLAERSVEKNKQQQTPVIPVLLHEVDWEYSIFGKLVPLPSDGRPITSWAKRNAAYLDVVRGIREVVTELKMRPESTSSVAPTLIGNRSDKMSPASSQSQSRENAEFDVFLCHNSKDKPEVKEIAGQLQAQGLNPWLDEWQLPPGQPWLPLLEQQIGTIKSAAVFVGANGRGPWQDMEIFALLSQFVKRKSPVIPVLLKDASKDKEPDLPIFLQGMTWVDFRKQDPDPLARLVWGITGKNPYGGRSGGVADQANRGEAPVASPTPVNASNKVNGNPVQLTLQQKSELVEKLLACPTMRERSSRNRVVQELTFANSIDRDPNATNKSDVMSIVNRCLDFSDGLQQLVERIEYREENSLPMQQLRTFVESLS